MAEAVALKPGTPSWVDLATPNLDESREFYAGVFGWKSEPGMPEYGGYTMFHKDGKEVAGGGPQQDPNSPPAWTTYVSVEDAKATVAKAEKAGAKVLTEPMEVMGQGTMAVLQDPTGAVIALWQPGNHKGAELYNVPGAICWNELGTRDTAAAKKFYKTVFGWEPETTGEGTAEEYTQFKVADRGIAGMLDLKSMSDRIPANWLTYFAVDDAQKAVDTAKKLGGEVRMGPNPSPFGPIAVLADPHGAVFAVIEVKA